MNEKYIDTLETEAVDAILEMLVTIVNSDKVSIDEKINTNFIHTFETHYNEWIADVVALILSKEVSDKVRIQDDFMKSDFYEFYSKLNAIDGHIKSQLSISPFTNINIHDSYDFIITQEFPAHQFED